MANYKSDKVIQNLILLVLLLRRVRYIHLHKVQNLKINCSINQDVALLGFAKILRILPGGNDIHCIINPTKAIQNIIFLIHLLRRVRYIHIHKVQSLKTKKI